MTLLNSKTPRAAGTKRVAAVIFDWAGTTVDFGSLAPVRTLERVFGEAGVPIDEAEARLNMGIAKRDHIAALLARPRVRTEWAKVRGREVTVTDIDLLYERFMPLQLACLKQYSKVIRGVPEVVEALRSRGTKIGSTTGYTRPMLDLLLTEAAREGYRPDCSVSPEETGTGRPSPFMIYAVAVKLQVYPMGAIVKVGDTESDIYEGLNAGVWSVGVAGTGNAVGLSAAAFDALSPAERAQKLEIGRKDLRAAGAHYVIDSLADLLPVIRDIETRLTADGDSA
jgi:phosphonoacetaldehyde hydrolase